MMSIEYIQALATEAATLARHQRLEPKVVAENPLLDEDLRSIPNLGDYVPEHWELVDTHFVDKTGLGGLDEPAMTAHQFATMVRTEIAKDEIFGWALITEGQFQVYVGQFKST